MQFETKYRAAIADGSIDLTFRRWKRPQVVAGNTYRTAAGRLMVDGVDVVDPRSITDEEARRAGYASAAALVAGLRGGTSLPVYRVAFRPATGADPETNWRRTPVSPGRKWRTSKSGWRGSTGRVLRGRGRGPPST
ncbi:hypothetical protein [Candidatus Amarobacter glycogenicus]|uniref:hypothetical protein n=1 Tax=Candidatus Amarobacter glycogenicus TaxID=3140699 RepID=UPI0031CC8041